MSARCEWVFPVVALAVVFLGVCSAHEADHPGSCLFDGHGSSHDHDPHHHHHHHHHQHDHGHHGHHVHGRVERSARAKLPEELAEEEDLAVDPFTSRRSEGDVQKLSGMGLWVSAMGCSLLVSMASLICLITLPLIFLHGKPSKLVVEFLALFGAGAMLGDAFLHQLPHALGGGHSHSNANHDDHNLDLFHSHGLEDSHSHSLNDLSVGLSVLAGIVLFLLVEKFVRYAEDHSESGSWGHGHYHHHHQSSSKSKKDEYEKERANLQLDGVPTTDTKCDASDNAIHKRSISTGTASDKKIESKAIKSSTTDGVPVAEDASAPSRSNLVLGYLNLFSDGVHNFTDGMALGSAFLVYGSVGGWSRTLFLLTHELPQEVGDFGILIRSGFSVPKALFFNFLSALVALGGTALALLLGKDPGQSSLIEGFTAGGFIYIAVAGVLPEINKDSTTVKTTVAQITALILGMSVALCISLVE